MGSNNTPQKNPLNKRQGQFSDKKEQLKTYLSNLKLHPPVNEHYSIAKSFDVIRYKQIFREDAIRRFLDAIYLEPTTVSTVEKKTGVKQKYLCSLKRDLEKAGRLKVVYTGQCKTTFSRGVQFLSSNQSMWSNKPRD